MKTRYYNGIIYPTMEASPVSEMIVENDMIVSIGQTNENQFDKEVDLNGRTVIPGLNDSHMHLIASARLLKQIDCTKATSIDSLIEQTINQVKEGNGWIAGRGWNQDYFDAPVMPTRYDLDRISTTRPICLIRACGHIAVVNSVALDRLNIKKGHIPTIEGGVIYQDEQGEPNGQFSEFALEIVYKELGVPTKETLKELILEGANQLVSMGVTSVQSDDFKCFSNMPFQMVIDAYTELAQEQKLPIRVYQQCLLPQQPLLQSFIDAGYHTGYGSDYYRLGPLKLLIDGSLGARTAWLSRPYHDDPSTSGVATYDLKQFETIGHMAHEHGMQLAVHTIGDQAATTALSLFERLNQGENSQRHGLVHAQITTMEQLQQIAKQRILAYVQPIFLHYDQHMVEDRVGPELAKTSYHFKTLMTLGAPVSYGTDSPVESFNPWDNIYCAMTRKDLNGNGPWHPNEGVTLKEALHCYSVEGAYASFEEQRKGCLTPGMLADFIVLDQPIFELDPEQIRATTVWMSVVGGIVRYQRVD